MENKPAGLSQNLRRPRRMLLETAKRIAQERQLRFEHFGDAQLFGEPAWDMLLHIFERQSDGRDVRIESISICTGLPMASALRWVEMLEKRGLVFAYHKKTDTVEGDQIYLRLSRTGYETMAQYLDRITQHRQINPHSK